MYTFMSINGSSGSCHPRRDAEPIPIRNRLWTDLHVVRKMKVPSEQHSKQGRHVQILTGCKKNIFWEKMFNQYMSSFRHQR